MDIELSSLWTNEHKMLFLMRHDLPFKEVLENKDLILADGDALRALFLDDEEGINMFKENSRPDNTIFNGMQETTAAYYRKILKLKGVVWYHNRCASRVQATSSIIFHTSIKQRYAI